MGIGKEQVLRAEEQHNTVAGYQYQLVLQHVFVLQVPVSSLAEGAENTDHSSFTGLWGGSNQEVLGSVKRLDLRIHGDTEIGLGPSLWMTFVHSEPRRQLGT